MKLFSGKMLETLLIEQRRYSEGLLPEIIKRLINCSGAEVDSLRIPDGDDVWAPGYDGIVSAKVESRYITAERVSGNLAVVLIRLRKLNLILKNVQRTHWVSIRQTRHFIWLFRKSGRMQRRFRSGRLNTGKNGKM